MQSDTFLPSSDSDDHDSSDESYDNEELSNTNNIGIDYSNNYNNELTFLNQMSTLEYEGMRNKLFTKDVYKKIILINSHSHPHGGSFNSSNYIVKLNSSDTSGTSTVTTDLGKLKNVIGFQLITASFRVPQFNVNTTNNVIKYKVGNSLSNIYTVTINPGYYNVYELATAFQVTTSTESHRVNVAAFTVTYYGSNATMASGQNGMKFKMEHTAGQNIQFLWDYDNVSRGAARLLGFLAIPSASFEVSHHSDKPPDLSHHYVDLVIPEIPSIACKRNSHGREVVERMQIRYPTGEYNQFNAPTQYWNMVSYFNPIELNQLTIQLYAENGELFDTNNTDNNFEFEVTMMRKGVIK